MPDESFVPLPGSGRRALPDAEPSGAVDGSERIELTVITRRRAELRLDASGAPVRISRDDLERQHGADPADLDLVAGTLSRLGLEVTGQDAGGRRVVVTGTVSALAAVFGAELAQVTSPALGDGGRATHRYRVGSLQVPAELDGVVVAVLGLDNRPQARYHYRRHHHQQAADTTSYTPPQVAGIYQFPANTDGTGQTIGIIELGGGFSESDLDTYFSSLGLPVPSVTAQGVDGASNVPGQDPNGADGEVELDIEVAGSVAPGAAQVVYFAPNTDQGFIDAVTTAVHATPTPVAVSISWGQSEDSWTAMSRSSLDAAIQDGAALGVTVTVAAGDSGSSDGVAGNQPHVDFPASSPNALGCGGTTLQADPDTGVISSETVWNDGSGATGGGVSDVFALPSWQASVGVPDNASGSSGRGVPDVAGNADPATGYQILVDGQQTVIGGTSAVAPLWAALIARLAQATGTTFGLIQTQLYAGVAAGQAAPGFQDITVGDNGAYSAGPGWDACTGLGSPDGTALLDQLSATTGAGSGAT
jgi:kumamolisin